MTKPVDDFKEYIEQDVLGHIAGITTKPMFGGWGFYLDGAIFAVIVGGSELCFKANAELAATYEAAGATQWVYTGHTSKKPTHMPYWHVPEHILEDKEAMADWVEQSATVTRTNKK